MIFVCDRIWYTSFKPDVVVNYEVVHDQKKNILKNLFQPEKFVSNSTNLASHFQVKKIACVFSDMTLGGDKYQSLVKHQLKWKTNLSPENETYLNRNGKIFRF